MRRTQKVDRQKKTLNQRIFNMLPSTIITCEHVIKLLCSLFVVVVCLQWVATLVGLLFARQRIHTQHELSVDTTHVAEVRGLVHDVRHESLHQILGAAEAHRQLAHNAGITDRSTLVAHHVQHGGHDDLVPLYVGRSC